MKLSFLPFKLLALVCAFFLIILCFIGCKESPNKISNSISYVAQVFPQDLLYGNFPIHPLCIITALHNKSPQPVNIEDLQLNLPDSYDIKNHTFSYDLEKKECGGSWKKFIDEDYAQSSDASYIYRGSYHNRHVVQANEHHYGSRYDCDNLIVIEREKDTICCVEDICQGDFDNVELEKNILRFEMSLPARCIDSIIARENIADLEKEIICIPNDLPQYEDTVRFGCFYEVDLDDPLWKLKLCGISFLERSHYGWSTIGQEECFCEVVLRYIEAGHQKLNLVQTESFVKDVWKSIAEKIAMNKSNEK